MTLFSLRDRAYSEIALSNVHMFTVLAGLLPHRRRVFFCLCRNLIVQSDPVTSHESVAILFCMVLYCTILYYATVQYCTVLYSFTNTPTLYVNPNFPHSTFLSLRLSPLSLSLPLPLSLSASLPFSLSLSCFPPYHLPSLLSLCSCHLLVIPSLPLAFISLFPPHAGVGLSHMDSPTWAGFCFMILPAWASVCWHRSMLK